MNNSSTTHVIMLIEIINMITLNVRVLSDQNTMNQSKIKSNTNFQTDYIKKQISWARQQQQKKFITLLCFGLVHFTISNNSFSIIILQLS